MGKLWAAGLLALALAGCGNMNGRMDAGGLSYSTPNNDSPGGAGSQLAMAPHRGPMVPAGFRVVAQTQGLEQPVALAVDDGGDVLVAWGGAKLTRLGINGGTDFVAQGPVTARFTGVAAKGGVYFVTSTGGPDGGSLLRVERDGRTMALLQGLPEGIHGISAPAVGPDGNVYVGVGSVTLAGIAEVSGVHDIACQDLVLNGHNFTQDATTTGAFLPLGTPSQRGQVITGAVPCTSSILRYSQDGGAPALVAWGFEDPRSLAFTPDGRLYVLDGDRSSEGVRSVTRGGDLVFGVVPGVWYGWPDAHGDSPLPPPLLTSAPNPPPRPAATFAAWDHAASMDLARDALFGGPSQAYVAISTPGSGYRVVRLDLRDGTTSDFANFPEGTPVALRFSPSGGDLFVLEREGVLWRIGRDVPVG